MIRFNITDDAEAIAWCKEHGIYYEMLMANKHTLAKCGAGQGCCTTRTVFEPTVVATACFWDGFDDGENGWAVVGFDSIDCPVDMAAATLLNAGVTERVRAAMDGAFLIDGHEPARN